MKVFLFILLMVIVIFIGLDQGWWTKPETPGPFVIPPVDPSPPGVSQKEKDILTYLKNSGCTVELSYVVDLYEKLNKPYDKLYSISWRKGRYSPRPGSVIDKPIVHLWNSKGDTYNDLVKIKKEFEDFQKNKVD